MRSEMGGHNILEGQGKVWSGTSSAVRVQEKR